MEILNSIWTALTTENEGITNLVIAPLAFVETAVSMLLFTQILNIATSKKQKILYILILGTWTVLATLFIPKPISIYLNMIIYILCIHFILKASWLKSIISEIMPILVIALFETIIVKGYSIFFSISVEELLTIPIHRLTSISIIYLCVFITYLITHKLNININIFDGFDKRIKRILILTSIIGMLAIALQFYLIMFYLDILPISITVISILVLIAYFFISLYAITRVSRLENTKQSLEEAQLYNKTLQILHDNVRAFRHDFSNIIAGIGGYVQTKDIEGLKKYYSQLLIDFQSTNNLTTLSPNLINNPAIYNVLANKYHKADEKGIKIELSIFYDFNKLNIKIYELTRILGILLDNAIEAASECDKKIINLIVRDEPNRNRQVILIENTYANKDVNTEAIYEKGVTSKQGNTGLGLWQVRQMMKKNDNLNLYTSKNEEYFSQALEIYN